MILNFYSFFNEISLSKRTAPDGMPHSAASHLELCGLPIPINEYNLKGVFADNFRDNFAHF